MPIPPRLDTIVAGNLVVSPEMAIEKKSGKTVIVVRVTDMNTRELKHVLPFDDYAEYQKFVDGLLESLK